MKTKEEEQSKSVKMAPIRVAVAQDQIPEWQGIPVLSKHHQILSTISSGTVLGTRCSREQKAQSCPPQTHSREDPESTG